MTEFRIRVDSNAAEVAGIMERIGRRIWKESNNAAARGTLLQLRTRVLREASRVLGIPQKLLRRRMYVKRRQPRALFIGTRPVPIIQLAARELAGGRRQRRGKGVSYKGPAGRERLEKAFIREGLGGKKHVFEREPGSSRLPVDVQTLEIHQPIERIVRGMVAGSFTSEKFAEIYAREFDFRVNREIERQRARTVTLLTR